VYLLIIITHQPTFCPLPALSEELLYDICSQLRITSQIV